MITGMGTNRRILVAPLVGALVGLGALLTVVATAMMPCDDQGLGWLDGPGDGPRFVGR